MGRGLAGLAAEPVAEIFLRRETAEPGDLGDAQVGVQQHVAGAVVADAVDLFLRGDAQSFPEQSEECGAVDIQQVGQLGDARLSPATGLH